MTIDNLFVRLRPEAPKDGKTNGDGVLYAIGRIGLFAPTGSPLKVDGELADLALALKDAAQGPKVR